jgi:hypothetical protein
MFLVFTASACDLAWVFSLILVLQYAAAHHLRYLNLHCFDITIAGAKTMLSISPSVFLLSIDEADSNN